MAKKPLQVTIAIAGKFHKSLQAAFKAVKKESNALDKAWTATKTIGVAAFKAVATAVGSVGTAVLASSEATREYRKDLAKMYNNAEMAGVAQKDAWSGLEDLYAISGQVDSANEAMSNLLATGYKGKDLTKVIEAINGATIKWQDTITQESLADAINETVKSGKSVGQFDEILARSGANIDRFNDGLLNCTGQVERQNYVLTWLANSGLTEVNEKYQEQNKSLVAAYKADLKYQNAMADLGKTSESLSATIKGMAAGAISYFAKKISGINLEKVSSALQKVGELGKKAFDTIWNALEKINWNKIIDAGVRILEVFTNIFDFVVNNWSWIAPTVYTIVGALTAYKVIMTAVNIVTAIMNSTLLASPFTWIVLAIAAVVVAFITLWNNCKWFRDIWIGVWEKVKSAFNTAKEKITSGFQTIKDKVQPIIDAVKKLIDKFKEVGEAIKNSKIGQAFGKVKDGISSAWNKITGNALGGTYSRPLLTWVAEAGDTETIVPHNNKPRSQALALEALKGTGLNIEAIAPRNNIQPKVMKLETVKGTGATAGGNTFVFSPTITVTGGNESDIRGILNDEFNKFKAQFESLTQGQRRLSY